MSCDCKHSKGGLCARYPKVSVTVMGKLAWAFPPADEECGERAVARPAKASSDKAPAKEQNPASDGARSRSNARKAKTAAEGSEDAA